MSSARSAQQKYVLWALFLRTRKLKSGADVLRTPARCALLSASDRSSLSFFRSARLARDLSVSKARADATTIVRAPILDTIHQYNGMDETIFVKEFMARAAIAIRLGTEYLLNLCG